ncbi:DUF4123 domain-containing protein [Entomomonas asaccharolytica]|uniref:DUF4123 domain-containing protein n=1 Tax=Entomomonas asaccharolytica TaxID=2785331 RepID=A0A974NGC0_9GAMM|nr:DUF4123 domain-containing protein [Entomomonas asaccharolytica]QQP86069.1 DUF4123 domain-containing protein [Entomomonas asaccharolytica]
MNELSLLGMKYQEVLKNLPWQKETISLLLDGINVKNIFKVIFSVQPVAKFEVLYLQTRFHELKEVSPCLIKIDSPASPYLQKFFAHLDDEWGYIVTSDRPWDEQVKHLRDLLVVLMPPNNQQVMLKIADPLVATELFKIAQETNNQLFGPFNHILTTDILNQEFHHYQKLTKNIIPLTLPYTLTESENNALDKVDIKRSQQNLYQHMQTYFPDFLNHYPKKQRRLAINHIIEEAEQLGYNSPMTQAFYLNIYGYLGDNALQDHPQITQLIKEQNIESLKLAAQRAQQISVQQASKGIA